MSEMDFRKMLSLYGRWSPSDDGKTTAFECSDPNDGSHGLVMLARGVDDGIIECKVSIPELSNSIGAFLVFRASGQEAYYAAGIGGWDHAFTLLEGHHLSPTKLASAGNISNIIANRQYQIRIVLEGQRVQVIVDEVKVIDYNRLVQVGGQGMGLLAFRGTPKAIFGPYIIDDRRPKAFVAMPFSDPYNEVYRDAIQHIIAEIGYEPVRVDDLSQPGIILNDIWTQITEASVILAEVTEPNPNVYYEIGIAHALNKPTVLLAQKGSKLPFDLGPHRCIFYENSIAGRARLLDALRASLSSVLGVTPNKPSP